MIDIEDITFRNSDENDLGIILDLLNNYPLELSTSNIHYQLFDFILAFHGDKLVGCLAHIITEYDAFVLRSMAVLKEYWGLDIAKKLNQMKIKLAKEMGFKKVYSGTLKINERAIGLLERLGFKRQSQEERYRVRPVCDGCRENENTMRPYCIDRTTNGCPAVLYGIDI